MIEIFGPLVADHSRPALLWNSAFERGTVAASSVAAGSFAANIAGPQTFDYWTPAAMPADLTLTLAAPEWADMFAVAAHDLASLGAGLTLQYSPDLSAPFVDVAAISPAQDTPLAIIFAPVLARRWRIVVAGALAPSIGVAMIGARLVVPEFVAAPYIPLARARRVELLAGNSLGGQMFAPRIKRGGGDTSVAFNPVPRAWAESDLQGFAAAYDAGGAFFFAASPELMPADLAYARRREGAGELRPAVRAGGMWCDLALEVETYGA